MRNAFNSVDKEGSATLEFDDFKVMTPSLLSQFSLIYVCRSHWNNPVPVVSVTCEFLPVKCLPRISAAFEVQKNCRLKVAKLIRLNTIIAFSTNSNWFINRVSWNDFARIWQTRNVWVFVGSLIGEKIPGENHVTSFLFGFNSNSFQAFLFIFLPFLSH